MPASPKTNSGTFFDRYFFGFLGGTLGGTSEGIFSGGAIFGGTSGTLPGSRPGGGASGVGAIAGSSARGSGTSGGTEGRSIVSPKTNGPVDPKPRLNVVKATTASIKLFIFTAPFYSNDQQEGDCHPFGFFNLSNRCLSIATLHDSCSSISLSRDLAVIVTLIFSPITSFLRKSSHLR